MALNERLKRFLDEQGAPYETLAHREVFTAREVASESHVAERQLAKVLAVKEESGRHLLVVLPASCRLDLAALKQVAGGGRLSLVREAEMDRLFPDCETGTAPPFGKLYGLPMFVDACFPRSRDIVFQAGNHHEVVRMSYDEYAQLAQPIVGEFCLHEREKVIAE